MGSIEIFRSRIKQHKHSVLMPLFHMMGDLGVYLGGGSFSHRVGKIREMRNFED